MNFGTIELDEKGFWSIKCEPHVRTKLKRYFANANQGASNLVRLSANAENARDLEMFLTRYPMEVRDKAALKRLAREHRTLEREISALLNGESRPMDFELALPARDYQRVAANALLLRRGLLLADKLGLGKSVSAICAMAKAENMPAVVVCPTHLPKQWARYLKKFAPNLRVHIIKKGTPYPLIKKPNSKQRTLWEDQLPDVLIFNYHKLRGWAETIAGKYKYVIFDECQQLRNDDSLIYDACNHVAEHAELRMGLSATPIFNYGGEFWNVCQVLCPGSLGTREEFHREWCEPKGNGKWLLRDPDAFGAHLRREGIMLRRTRKEVGRELPEAQRIPHYIDADTNVLESMTGSDAIELAKRVLRRNQAFKGDRMQASGQFDMIMRQATGVAKAPYVADFVRMLVESGEKVLLAGWHHAVYEIWRERLADLGIRFFTGMESTAQQDKSMEDFLYGDCQVLAMSLRAGAGTDGMQEVCKTVVIGELDWSHGIHEQIIGRVDRDPLEYSPGDRQVPRLVDPDEPPVAYFMLAEDGSDPIVSDVIGVKLEQSEGVLNPDAALVQRKNSGEDDIKEMARRFLDKHGIDWRALEAEAPAEKKELEPA